MKRFSLLVTVIGLVTLAGCGSSSPLPMQALPARQTESRVLEINTTFAYWIEVSDSYFWKPYKWNDRVQNTVRGTACRLDVQGRALILTAAHLVCPPKTGFSRIDGRRKDGSPKWYPIGTGYARIAGDYCTIRLSSASLTPKRICVDMENDIALIELAAPELSRLQAIPMRVADRPPLLEEQVKVWGYPHTPLPQLLENLKVTFVDDRLFVLNRPVEGGTSGGPVLSETNDLLGMAVRSDDQQTRCIPSTLILRLVNNFQRLAVDYSKDELECDRLR